MPNMYGLKRNDSIILSIDRDETTIGRHTSNHIVINETPVSRYHSCIVRINGQYFIKDKNTMNGTYIKKHKLLCDRETRLKVGDCIGIGGKAGENLKCTLEVVLIQFNNTNEASAKREETPSVVDSSTDQIRPGFETPTNTTILKTPDITNTDMNSTSGKIINLEEHQAQKSVENMSDLKVSISPSNLISNSNNNAVFNSGTKIEPIDSTTKVDATTKILAGAVTEVMCGPSTSKSEGSIISNTFKDILEVKNEQTANENDVRSFPNNSIMVIDLCHDDDDDEEEELAAVLEEKAVTAAVDIKPLFTAEAEFSTLDEITILDSDDDDFPCSQLNTSLMDDLPDFSASFESMYNENDDDPESTSSLHCMEDTWFKSSGEEMVIDLPMVQPKNSKDRKNKSLDPHNKEPTFNEDHRKQHSLKKPIKNSKVKRRSPKRRLSKDDLTDVEPKPKRKDSSHCTGPEPKKNDLSDCISKPYASSKAPKKQESVFKVITHDSALSNYQPVVLLEDYYGKPKPSSELPIRRKSIEILEDDKVFRLEQIRMKKKKKCGPRSRTMTCESTSIEEKEYAKREYLEFVENDKKLLKERRKEKLREITLKKELLSMTSKPESSNRDVVAKCTKENRADKMYKNTDTTTNIPVYTEMNVAPEYEERSREFHGLDSFYDDALDLCSQVPESSIQSVPKKDIQVTSREEKEASPLTMDAKFVGPSKRVSHAYKKMELVIDNNNLNVSPPPPNEEPLNTEAVPVAKIIECQKKSKDKQKQSPPKFGFYVDTMELKNNTGKRVHFNNDDPDCQLLDIDPEERCNGIYTSSYKKENLIKERQAEFEKAIGLACRWKVDWLKVQQELGTNVYLKSGVSSESSDAKLLEYKENLKEAMFHHLWDAVSQSHNKPNQDYLPNTQCLNEGKKGIYTLWIESVNTSKRPPHLRTITAYREVDENVVRDELASGQMVILHLRVKQTEGMTKFSKANIFAYVASAHQVLNKKGVKLQRVILKVFQKNFEIMIGEIKVKVLTYTKLLLKRFEPLAMLVESPLIDLLVGQRSEPLRVPPIHDEQNFVNIHPFLDSSQKCAIVKCLNSILSPEPSVCLVDGPPGAGKTVMIASLMHEMFSKAKRDLFPTDLKVLIITKNDNMADDLVHRLEKRDKISGPLSMNVLRYGRCKLFSSPKLRHCTIGDQVKKIIEEDKENSLVDLEEEKRITLAKMNSFELVLGSENLTEDKRVNAEWRLAALKNEYADLLSHSSKTKNQLLEKAAKSKTFENANVIVTSIDECWRSPYSPFENDFVFTEYNRGDVPKFTACIFDDANYTDETQMLIPIMLMVPNLVLVGDSRDEFHHKKGEKSPFRRFLYEFKKKGSNAIVYLKYQHRMLPGVFKWFSGIYQVPLQPLRQSKMSRLVPLLMVHLQIENCVDFDYDVKWMKQANFCHQLALKVNEIESDLQIAIVVVSNEEKKMLQEIIPNHAKITIYTWDDTIGREYEAVIACFSTKPYPIDKWLYIASSRARFHLFMCGYFDDDLKTNKYIQYMKVASEIRKMYIMQNVDEDLPSEILQARQYVD